MERRDRRREGQLERWRKMGTDRGREIQRDA